MFQDWQTIAVWLIILAALAYVGRRGWARLRSFRAGGKGQATSCATGCGSCGDERPERTAAAPRPQNVLVQITTAGGERRRPG
ncbi:MAG TPA: FeoB-associated Cys-rich membrane protein [Pyrinomonadaceae bacterium]|nr:FeoB-associated Cys-rich membrane protein [Pyrinomonadaceae bacterium]